MTPRPPTPTVAPVAGVAPSTGIEGTAVDGLDLILDDLTSLLSKYVSFPSSEALWAVAAWTVHSGCIPEIFDSTPRLGVLSPAKRSGKTRLLEVLELVVRNPVRAANISPSALYRIIETGPRTLLIDEADTVWGAQKSERNEDLRGIVNGGHRRGSMVLRTNIGKGGITVTEFETFAPVVLAGIGDLPDTILDRSVIITMRRRLKTEKVEPFRFRIANSEAAGLKDRIKTWTEVNRETIAGLEPALPEGIEDRAADVWEPLVIIGDLAGHEWSQKIRQSAVVLNNERIGAEESLGIKLLNDCRTVFEDEDRFTTDDLLNKLILLEESPWCDLRGKPLNALGLAKRLAQYQVKPGTHRFGVRTVRGYLRSDFEDAWDRYLEHLITPVEVQHAQQVQQVKDEALLRRYSS